MDDDFQGFLHQLHFLWCAYFTRYWLGLWLLPRLGGVAAEENVIVWLAMAGNGYSMFMVNHAVARVLFSQSALAGLNGC